MKKQGQPVTTDSILFHLTRLMPFLKWRNRVTRQNLQADGLSGLTGALIVLPQAIAFATIAGLPPEYGLYAAMVPTIIAALFGSSWHLVSGPTTAISLLVFEAISPVAEPGTAEYIRIVLTLTFLTGIFQLAMGVARMGTLVNFISHTVIIGFTTGAALLIAASQIRNFFGIEAIERGTPAYLAVEMLFLHLHETNPYILAVSALSLSAGILSRRFVKKVPYMITAMVAGGLAAALLNGIYGSDLTRIQTVGALTASLPPFSVPDLSILGLKSAFFPALTITVLALTEAVSISRSIAMRSDQRIDSNQEFIGQGLSNIAGSFFSSFASSGSFNRSGVNYEAGAKTPLAAVFSAIFLLGALFFVAPLVAYLPLPAMAAVLFMVAWNLVDLAHIRVILRHHRTETVILAVTFLGTIIDLEKGIFLGILVSLMFYLSRTARPVIRTIAPDPAAGENQKRKFLPTAAGAAECPQLRIARIDGSIFFGATDHIQQALVSGDTQVPERRHLLVLADSINFVDLAGEEMLAREAKRRSEAGGGLYLCGVKNTINAGTGNIFTRKSEAIAAIIPRLDPEICRQCRARIFHECTGLPAPPSQKI